MSEIHLIEVGLRDGLQSVKTLIPTKTKATAVRMLAKSGLSHIQVAAFVHPRIVPQMADAEALIHEVGMLPGITLSALILNKKGLDRALATGISAVDLSFSASDLHSRANTRLSLERARQDTREMIHTAKAQGLKVRLGIQCAFGHPKEPHIAAESILDSVIAFQGEGVDEIALADSAGLARPHNIKDLVLKVKPLIADLPLILHLHDTHGYGMANFLEGLNCGIRHFDTAFGGLGGCPFIPGAKGNLGTEAVIHYLKDQDYDCSVTDIAPIESTTQLIAKHIQKTRQTSYEGATL